MGKKTSQQTWECYGDGSAKCSLTTIDCFYCDPFGLKRSGSYNYDGDGTIISDLHRRLELYQQVLEQSRQFRDADGHSHTDNMLVIGVRTEKNNFFYDK